MDSNSLAQTSTRRNQGEEGDKAKAADQVEAAQKPEVQSTNRSPKQQNKGRPSTIIPKNITAKLDQVYAKYGDRKLHLDLLIPINVVGPKPCLVVVHGGGWHQGDKEKFRALAIEMAKRGCVVAAIEYRLADEAAFPAAMHDCSAVVRYLRANAERFQIDAKHVGAIGGSAGGHLVGLMASGAGNQQL